MRRTVNIKLVAILLLGALLFAGGVHLTHRLQEQRNASALLEQAQRAEDDGQKDQAVKHLRAYLGFVPNDTEALARYGRLLNQQAATPTARTQALLILEQVLRRDPTQHEIRRELIDLAMHPQVRRHADAREHLEILLRDRPPTDGELQHLLGRCLEVEGEFAPAAAAYQKALSQEPQRIDSYLALADIYRRRLEKPKQADEVMAQLVAANPTAFRAYLARGHYRKQYGKLDEATADLARAGELAPDEADVILGVAGVALLQNDLDGARKLLRRGLELHPTRGKFYLALAEVEVAARQGDAAVRILRQGVAQLPAQSDVLLALASTLVQQGKEPTEELAVLAQRGAPAPQRDFLQARILFNQQQWLPAARLLEKVQSELRPWPELARQANVFLGECYGRLGSIDQQYAAYRRAVSADPLWAPAGLGLAATQAAMGRHDEAIGSYRRILPRAPEAGLPLARLLLARNTALPADQQDWTEVDKLLADAPADALETTLTRAEVLAARQQAAAARDLLDQARTAQPKQLEPWLALAALSERQGQTDVALTVLNDAAKQVGDRVELRLARAWHAARQGGAAGKQQLAQLQENMTEFSAAEQVKLLRGLAGCSAQIGDRAGAERLYRQAAELAPTDLGVRLALFEFAMQSGNADAQTRLLREIETIEGKDGTLWRFGQACQLIRQARQGQRDAAAQARTMLTQLATVRPTWSRVPLALADLDDAAGDTAAAVKNYQKAIELGERDPRTLRRLVSLLSRQGRFKEADEFFRKTPGFETAGTEANRLGAELALRGKDEARAVQLARQAVPETSQEYRDFLWLGQLLASTSQKEQAEPALRRAVALAEAAPEAWAALVLHLARSGQREKAAAALKEAETKLTREQEALALPACHEALGQIDQARTLYSEAVQARPNDAALRRGLAGLCLRHGPPADAEKHLRQLVGLKQGAPEDAAWARRTLAVLLASSGDLARWREGLALVGLREDGALPQPTAENFEDLRSGAIVLAAQKTRQQRQRAIQLLESLAGKQPLPDEEQFLLAQLHEALGDWPKARQQLLQLVAAQSTNPRYVAHYAQALVRRKDAAEAEIWLNKLAKLPGAAGSFTLVDLRARIEAARGNGFEVEKVVQAYRSAADAQPADAAARLQLSARLLDDLNHPAADKLYQEMQAQQPERVLERIALQTRRGEIGAALDLCESAWKSCPPEMVAGAALVVLRSGKASPEQQQRIERWLTTAAAKAPKPSAGLLICVADLRDFQGKHAEAEKLYRQALTAEPGNVVALNNLAYLLALQENKGGEALELLARAVKAVGATPELLDTRAVIHMRLGQPQQAIRDLESAIADAPQPALCFHLAQAHQQLQNATAARAAFRQGRSLGLAAEQLHALERASYQQLHAELETR